MFSKQRFHRQVQTGILAVFVLFLGAGFVQAAGFDCNKASTAVEKLICSDYDLSTLDDKLNLIYGNVVKSGVIEKKELKSGQLAWLKRRNQCKEEECIRKSYQERIAELERLLSGKWVGNDTNYTGTYDSGNGTFLILHFPDDTIRFHFEGFWINQTTGMANTGALTRLVELKGHIATFVDPETDCVLILKFKPDYLHVTQEGFCPFGMNVTANGEYIRKDRNAPKFADIIY